MKRVLFICAGNVGRSQIAASLFNNYNIPAIACSAGTKVVDSPYLLVQDHPKATNVIRVTQEKGIDISNNIRTQFTSKVCAEADVIINMTGLKLSTFCETTSLECFTWNFEDPFEKDYETTKTIFELIKKHVAELVNTLNKEGSI